MQKELCFLPKIHASTAKPDQRLKWKQLTINQKLVSHSSNINKTSMTFLAFKSTSKL